MDSPALFTPARERSWHQGLHDTPTINGKSCDLLKYLMNDVVNDGLIATNPYRIVGAGKPRAKGAAEAFSVAEIGPYLDAVEDYCRPASAVAVLGGLRSGEIRGPRRRDPDMEQGSTRVARAIRREQVKEANTSASTDTNGRAQAHRVKNGFRVLVDLNEIDSLLRRERR